MDQGDLMRDVEAIGTEYGGTTYRSRTEARWAIFFEALGVEAEYEAHPIRLSTGAGYLPDFYIPAFRAWFEVKARNDAIVTEEASKARQLAADRQGERVWLAIGPPSSDEPNILTLDQWSSATPIEEILETPENRYRFLEDRRDDGVYWLQADFIEGGFRASFMVGGPGRSTPHDRLPLLQGRVAGAYVAARDQRW